MAEEKLNILETSSNEDNIQDVIKKAGIVTSEIAQFAADKIAKRRNEAVTEELISIVQKCEWVEKSTHISYQRSNKCNKKIKEYLKSISELKESITTGKAPVSDWDKKSEALKKQLDKDLVEIGKNMDELQRDLDNIFPSSWSYRYQNLVPKR